MLSIFSKSIQKNAGAKKEQLICSCGGKVLELLTKKPLIAKDDELKENPPSRSAKLRAAEKIADIGV